MFDWVLKTPLELLDEASETISLNIFNIVMSGS